MQPARTRTHTHAHTCIHINKHASLVLCLCLCLCLLLLCMMYMYTYIVYRAVNKYMWTQAYRYSRTTPAESRTHAHLIDVPRIGASLQHLAQNGHDSIACVSKQERFFFLVSHVGHLGASCPQALEHVCVLCEL